MKCPKCHGSSFILKKNEYGEDVWYPCECRIKKDQEALLEAKLTDANIRKNQRMYTFDDYASINFSNEIKKFNQPQIERYTSILDNPQTFIENFSTLWLWGSDPNAGHTTLAIILGIELIKKDHKVRFIKMQDLLDAFTEFDKKSDYFQDLERFTIYIIDNAFVKDRSIATGEYTRVHLFNFIETALEKDKHFIMTSDRHVDEIDTNFDQVRMLLKRRVLELELRGSIIDTKKNEDTLATEAKKFREKHGW